MGIAIGYPEHDRGSSKATRGRYCLQVLEANRSIGAHRLSPLPEPERHPLGACDESNLCSLQRSTRRFFRVRPARRTVLRGAIAQDTASNKNPAFLPGSWNYNVVKLMPQLE